MSELFTNRLKLYSLIVIATLNLFNVDKIHAKVEIKHNIILASAAIIAIGGTVFYKSQLRHNNKTKTNIKDTINYFKYDSNNIEKIYNPLYKICFTLNSDYNIEYTNGLEELSNLINSDIDIFIKNLQKNIVHVKNKIKNLDYLKKFHKSFSKLEIKNGFKIKEQYQIILNHLNIVESTILNHFVFFKESNTPTMIAIKTANKKIEKFNKDYSKFLQTSSIEQYLISQNEDYIRQLIQDHTDLCTSYDDAIAQVNKDYYEWHKETKVYAKIEILKTEYSKIKQKINTTTFEQIKSYANYFALKNNSYANQELYNAFLVESENITKHKMINKSNHVIAQAISYANISSKRVYPHIALYNLTIKYLNQLKEINNKITLYSLHTVDESKIYAQNIIAALQTITGFIIFSKDYQDESTARQKDEDIKQLEETCNKLQRKITTQETKLNNVDSKCTLLDSSINQRINYLSDKLNRVDVKIDVKPDYSLINKVDRLASKVAKVEDKVAKLENQLLPPAYSPANDAPPVYSK